MRFDSSIANPPYKRSLHIEFAEKMQKLATESAVVLQPSRFMLEEDPHSLSVSSVTLFNGNSTGISLASPLSITVLKNSSFVDLEVWCWPELVRSTILDVTHVTVFPEPRIFNRIKQKVRKYCDPKQNVLTTVGDGGEHKVLFPSVKGHYVARTESFRAPMYKNDFFTFFPKSVSTPEAMDRYVEEKANEHPDWPCVGFENKKERDNYFEYLTSREAEFCLALAKYSPHTIPKKARLVPVFDFSIPITTERFKEEMGLTAEEVDYIHRTMPNFYADEKPPGWDLDR